MRRSLLGLSLLTLSACATIAGGGSSQAVSVQTSTPGATFVVKSSSGIQMAAGQAPQTIRLPRKNEYQIEFTAPGFQTQTIALTKGTNGWVWGNLVVGWIVGFIIDFSTGSAYKLEPALVNISLVTRTAADGSAATDARVAMLDDQGKQIRELVVPMVPLDDATLAPATP